MNLKELEAKDNWFSKIVLKKKESMSPVFNREREIVGYIEADQDFINNYEVDDIYTLMDKVGILWIDEPVKGHIYIKDIYYYEGECEDDDEDNW